MQKNFDDWNYKKKLTNNSLNEIIFYEREVWWYIAGLNIGMKINGKHEFYLRPCVIVRKFNKDMTLIVPTTNQQKFNKYYFLVQGRENKSFNICLSQIRTISSKRLFRKIDTIQNSDYKSMLEKLSNMIRGILI